MSRIILFLWLSLYYLNMFDETTGGGYANDFELRVQQHMDILRGCPLESIAELAATSPGGALDAPFAPIDPTLHAAANRLLQNMKASDAAVVQEHIRQLRRT